MDCFDVHGARASTEENDPNKLTEFKSVGAHTSSSGPNEGHGDAVRRSEKKAIVLRARNRRLLQRSFCVLALSYGQWKGVRCERSRPWTLREVSIANDRTEKGAKVIVLAMPGQRRARRSRRSQAVLPLHLRTRLSHTISCW